MVCPNWIPPFDQDNTGLDEEALVWQRERVERGKDGAVGASLEVDGRATRSIAMRAFQRMFGHSAWQLQQLRHLISEYHHCGVDTNDTEPSASLAIGQGLEQGTIPIPSIFIKSEPGELLTPILADTANGSVGFDAEAQTERALVRQVALAAAVTIWCILQPFILFFVIAHFQQHV